MNTDTGIYSITSPSGKQYIGSARSFKARWAVHRHHLRLGTHHSPALQKAWNKYGEEQMLFAKITLCSVPDLLIVEQSRIASMRPAYNVCMVAGSQLGMRHSATARKKMSEANKGERHPNWGKAVAAETRERISRAQQGEKAYWWGKSPSAESRQKMSLAKLGKTYDDCARSRMALSKMGAKNPVARAVICVETGMLFVTGAAAAKWLQESGFPASTKAHISAAASGKRKSAYGYAWRYAA